MTRKIGKGREHTAGRREKTCRSAACMHRQRSCIVKKKVVRAE